VPPKGLPNDETFGPIIYHAPEGAFEDGYGERHTHAVVTWGMGTLKPNPYTGVEWVTEEVRESVSTYRPGDAFCHLKVGDEHNRSDSQVPVTTFGTVLERRVPEGGTVAPGDPLFVLDARPPTTAEWVAGHEAFRAQESEAIHFRTVLRHDSAGLLRLIWRERRQQRRQHRERAKLGRRALKEWKAEQRRKRRARS
jgi:multidrug efflux pump subunit AcrA (membrane-fusion protein)